MEDEVFKTGKILIAHPFMLDPYFSRSVVFIASHEKQGTVGYVLNQYTNLNVRDFFKEIKVDFPIFVGGPVDTNTLSFIHTKNDLIPNSIPITQNISLGSSIVDVVDLINEGSIQSNEIRFFVGYSGWTARQLEMELADDTWIVSKMKKKYLNDFYYPNLWAQSTKESKHPWSFLSDYAFTPSHN